MHSCLLKASFRFSFLVLIPVILTLSSCSKESPSPAISEFYPPTAAVGISLTIIGTNFSSDPAKNVVTIGGVHATVTDASPTELIVTIPEGVQDGFVQVTVSGSSGVSEDQFEVCAGAELFVVGPTITSRDGTTTLYYDFDIINVGAVTVDLADYYLQNYASTNATFDIGDAGAGGWVLNSTLPPGSKLTGSFNANFTSTVTQPYWIFTIASTSVVECDSANNNRIIYVGPE